MALFRRGYDRNNYGYRSSPWDRVYDFGYRGAQEPYEGDFGYYGHPGAPNEYQGGRYDRGYKSRWETDYGDPFGDRAAHTPMRMIHGRFHGRYDRGEFRGQRPRPDYGRDYYGSNPMGYDPYAPPREERMRGYDRMRHRSSGGYDTRWF